MVAVVAGLLVAIFIAVAEILHARRSKRLAYLSHGPGGEPRAWVKYVPVLRIVSAGLMCWGLIVLFSLPSLPVDARSEALKRVGHLILALDVSPSMDLEDAGMTGRQSRGDRARDLLRSAVDRVNTDVVKVTLIVFYTGAKPVVIDASDPDVIENIMNDLPMQSAFNTGKTDLYSAVKVAAKTAEPWYPDTASLVIVTDGDTLPGKPIPDMPPSISQTVVLGVGSTSLGGAIDGHISRQEPSVLGRLAARLGGHYIDASRRDIPLEQLDILAREPELREAENIGRKELAVLAVVSSALMIAGIAPALALAGCQWHRELRRLPLRRQTI